MTKGTVSLFGMKAKPMPNFNDEEVRLLDLRLEALIPDRPSDGCWIPTLTARIGGYVPWEFRGHRTLMHRWTYWRVFGEPGEVLDHLCENRECCNPAHLSPTSHQGNIRRGSAPTAVNAVKTQCIAGHAFTPENTRVTVDSRGMKRRHCRKCVNRRTVESRRRRAAEN